MKREDQIESESRGSIDGMEEEKGKETPNKLEEWHMNTALLTNGKVKKQSRQKTEADSQKGVITLKGMIYQYCEVSDRKMAYY